MDEFHKELVWLTLALLSSLIETKSSEKVYLFLSGELVHFRMTGNLSAKLHEFFS